jgi:imidazole glycerol phosphate synthase subunit HisF
MIESVAQKIEMPLIVGGGIMSLKKHIATARPVLM